MQHLTLSANYSQQSPKTDPKLCLNWLQQLVGLFPPSPMMTKELLTALTAIFCKYPEATIKEICSPTTGMPSSFKYLPGIMEFGQYCAARALELDIDKKRIQALEKQIRAQALPRPVERPLDYLNPEFRPKECYWGPFEEAKPGMLIHWSRLDEYELYAKSKGFSAKQWGVFEQWRDNGARPFATNSQQAEPAKKEEPNPFEG